MPRRKQRSSSGSTRGVALDELSDDEIDAFHAAQDFVGLDAGADAAGSDSDDGDEAVFALPSEAAAADLSDDDFAGESAEDGRLSGWGRKKSAYYELQQGGSRGTQSAEAAELEEAEVRRLQRAHAAVLAAEDFAGAAACAPAAGDDAGRLVAAMDRELAAVERVERDASALSREERLRIVAQDSPELAGLLADFRAKLRTVREELAPLVERVRRGELQTSRGVSFLELKYHTLLAYCTNAAFYLLLKAEGKPVRDHPVVEELVRLRAVMEKLRPVEKKLRYQLDKLLKAAAPSASAAAASGKQTVDPLRFRSSLADGLDEEDEDAEDAEAASEDEDADGAASTGGLYRPPRLREVPYDEDEAAGRKSSRKAKREARTSRDSLAAYVHSQYGDAPEEAAVAGARLVEQPGGEDGSRRSREKAEYEEERFVRLGETRAERAARTTQRFVDELGALTADIADEEEDDGAMEDGEDDARRVEPSRKRVLTQTINAVAQRAHNMEDARDRRMVSADSDIGDRAMREQPPSKRARQAAVVADDDDDEIPSDEADGYDEAEHAAAAAAKRAAKMAEKQKRREKLQHRRSKKAKARIAVAEELPEGYRREVSRQIEKNRGLVRNRAGTKANTPHARTRAKFEKRAMQARRQGPARVSRSKPFTGEAAGIKPRLVRSTKI